MPWVTCDNKKNNMCTTVMLLIVWTQLQRFFGGITKQLVKPICFVFEAYRVKKKWCKKWKISLGFSRQRYNKNSLRDLEEIEIQNSIQDWVFPTIY